MKYALEDHKEFERLEQQSSTDLYQFKTELEGLQLLEGSKVLDAGSGSGIVSRTIAEQYSAVFVLGCDLSIDRVKKARLAAAHLPNCNYQTQDLTKLTFEDQSFDTIFCRFVIHHLSKEYREKALSEFFRVLKPGGTLRVVDVDGYFYNLYPQPKVVEDFLKCLDQKMTFDLKVGRKLPSELSDLGFDLENVNIEMMNTFGKNREVEIKLIEERFEHTRDTLASILGVHEKGREFEKEFLQTLKNPTSTLFYNKFVITAKKPTKLSLVKGS